MVFSASGAGRTASGVDWGERGGNVVADLPLGFRRLSSGSTTSVCGASGRGATADGVASPWRLFDVLLGTGSGPVGWPCSFLSSASWTIFSNPSPESTLRWK